MISSALLFIKNKLTAILSIVTALLAMLAMFYRNRAKSAQHDADEMQQQYNRASEAAKRTNEIRNKIQNDLQSIDKTKRNHFEK